MERRLTFPDSEINLLQTIGDPSKSFITIDDNCATSEISNKCYFEERESTHASNVSKHFEYQIHDFDLQVLSADWSEDETYVKIRDFTCFQPGDLENAGIVTDRLIEVCSTRLKRAAYPGKYALCNCNLQRKNLISIDLLEYHPFLQYLDLSRNKLTTLKPLEFLPFLKYLNASHNSLTQLLDFKPPVNLTYVDCSHNTIETLPDLTDFWSLVYLDVSYNMITEMEGLENLMYLNFLNLSYNNISCVSCLPKRNLEILYLDNNNISYYSEDVVSVYSLNVVSMGNNKLTSLEMFSKMGQLRKLFLFHNDIEDLYELINLKYLPVLNTLDIYDNPVCKNEKFREISLFMTPSLRLLNGELLEAHEKGYYDYLYKLDSKILATYLDCMMEILRNLNIQEIDSAVVPCYRNSVPILLIVGPTGSGKKVVIRSLLEKFPFFKQVISHTTRRKCNGEVEGKDYYFINNEEFQELEINGKFICVSLKYGSSFGISYDELRKVSSESDVLLVHCDLISALQIKSKFVQCIMVLAMPRDIKLHKEWLREKFYCSHWINNHLSAYLVNYKAKRVSSDILPRTVYIQEMLNDMLKFIDVDLNNEESEEHQEENSINQDYHIYSETSVSKIMSILKHHDEYGSSNNSTASDDTLLDQIINKSNNDMDTERTKTIQDKKISFSEVVHSSFGDVQSKTSTSSTSIIEATDIKKNLPMLNIDNAENIQIDLSYRRSDFFDCYYQSMSDADDVILFEYFIAEQGRSRKKYLDIYLKCPGFFVTMVDTMDLDQTMQQLDELVKMWMKYHKKGKKMYDCTMSQNCPKMMKEKMDMIFEMF